MSYNARVIITVIGIQFAGAVVLAYLGYESLVLFYFLLFMGISQLLAWLVPKLRRFTHDKSNISVPSKFQEFHDELIALGFEPQGMGTTIIFFLPSKQWFYLQRDEQVYAYISDESSRLWFSSYFEKGFDVTTRFRDGDIVEKEKMVAHIIKTSISLAYEYHLRHCQKYLNQYGPMLTFDSIPQHLEWDKNQNVLQSRNREGGKGIGKFIWRFVLGFITISVITFVIGVIVAVILLITMPLEEGEVYFGYFAQFMVFLAPLAFIVWMFWPMVFPKTVEDNKKKKLRS